MMDILSHPFTADSCSFEAFDGKVSMHERRATKVIHVVVNDGCVLKKMADESLKDHLVLQSNRFTTCAMVRDEIMDVVQAGAAAGSSPILVDALTKGNGKKGKGEGKDPKSKDVKGKGKGWNSKAKDNGAKCQDSKDSHDSTAVIASTVPMTCARRRPQDDPSWTRVPSRSCFSHITSQKTNFPVTHAAM